MLKIEHLNCGYGSVHAVHDVSFDVPAGSVFALLGPNGAGKTSTIMAIMGHVDIHGGRILLEDADITYRPAVERVRLGISLVPEGRQLFSDLSVDENLTIGGYARPAERDAAKRDRVFDYFPTLSERRGQLAGSLSGGEQQMLAIGRILRTGARLLLLDEPTEGLAPVIIQQIGRTIAALKAQGFTILLVEQNFHFAATVADRYYVMEHGRIVDHFVAAELKANTEKLHDYLGV